MPPPPWSSALVLSWEATSRSTKREALRLNDRLLRETVSRLQGGTVVPRPLPGPAVLKHWILQRLCQQTGKRKVTLLCLDNGS